MKKLLLTTSLICFILGVASASVINWTCTPPLTGPNGIPAASWDGVAFLFDASLIYNTVDYSSFFNELKDQTTNGYFNDYESQKTVTRNVEGGLLKYGTNIDVTAWQDGSFKTLIMVVFDGSGEYFKIGQVGPLELVPAGQSFAFGSTMSSAEWVKIIPEPATMALVGIGIVALGLRRRRK